MILRRAIAEEVRLAHARGETYHEILADLATTLGWLIAAASPDNEKRVAFVKKAMETVAAEMRKPAA